MALNAAVIMPPLQQVIFDKTLDTFLSNGQVFFWEDSNRTIPKNVYTLTGTGPGSYTYVSLGAELTLSGIGSFIDSSGGNIAIYLWPFTGTPNDNPASTTVQNYYITVYSSTSVFQFDIPNWPGTSESASPVDEANTTENIISNGQFVDVNFPTTATMGSPFTTNVTGTLTETEIAPGWVIVSNGSGTLNLYRQIVLDSTAQGNPAYALGLSSTGFNQPLQLRQRILAPRILAEQFASATFLAQSFGGAITLTMNYTPSLTGTIQQICTGTTLSSGFDLIANSPAVQITNPGSGSGYVDISIVIPLSSSVQITCVQFCGVIDALSVVAYLQETPEREIDHLFHYFQPRINFKPIPSLLTGWDFPLNPKQFGITSFSTTPIYVWDQTIMCSTVGNINVTTISGTDAMSLQTNNPNEAIYMLQYLKGPEAVKTTLSRLSVNINAYSLVANNVRVNVFLYYSSPNGTIPTLPTTIGSIDNALTGHFALSASGWVLISQDKSFQNFATLPFNSLVDTQFSGWNNVVNFGVASTDNFAMVVTFAVPTAGTVVALNSISCVPGDIPTRPAPQTQDEVLRECQLYYESSSPYAGLPAASGYANAVSYPMQTYIIQTGGAGSTTSYPATFNLIYKIPKRAVPNINIFSANAGTSGSASCTIYYTTNAGGYNAVTSDASLSNFWTGTIGNSAAYYFPKGTIVGPGIAALASASPGILVAITTAVFGNSEISFNYTIDARLGVV